MQTRSKRQQIRAPPALLDRLRTLARERRTSVAELIRSAVQRTYCGDHPAATPLDAVRRLATLDLPVSDWQQMEAESVSAGCDDAAGLR